MGITETAVLYGVIGLTIAVAVVLREERATPAGRLWLFGGALCFWPFFAPGLLAQRSAGGGARPGPGTPLATRIRITEEQLLSALGRVEGVAEEVLAPELARIRGLSGALQAMEKRLAEMAELLATPEFDERAAQAVLADLATRGHGDTDARVQSVKSRLRNIDRLRAMRARTAEDLERVLLKLEEMSSQILLLKFAGRPEEEVVRLIKEIAESVEGVTEGLLAAS